MAISGHIHDDEEERFEDNQPEEDWGDDEDGGENGDLGLEGEDGALPWLESGDEDEEYGEYEGSDTGRILGFLIAGLLVIGLIVGGIWWMTHRSTDPELLADGSTIPAPEEPYKSAPEEPGGKQFAGTGDSSYAVSEGKNPAAKLGEQGVAKGPSVDLNAGAGAGGGAAPAGNAAAGAEAAPAASGIGVQVGAYSSRAAAEKGWSQLQSNPALSGVAHRVVEGQADIGTVYRLQAVPGDAAAARTLCNRLSASGVSCQVKN